MSRPFRAYPVAFSVTDRQNGTNGTDCAVENDGSLVIGEFDRQTDRQTEDLFTASKEVNKANNQ